MKHALLLSSHYGVCVEWLLTGRGPKVPAATIAAVREDRGLYTAETLRLAEEFQSLPPPDRALFQGLLTRLLNPPPGTRR